MLDPTSDSATYAYDPAGNLLSISRQAASATTILDFTPRRGIAGTTVTIYGSGFNPDPGQNTVDFNGTPAAVTSATADQIVTSAPAGASTGPITVSTPGGSAASRDPFTVAGDVMATITPGGPPVTVTIPTPGQMALVTFDGTAAQRVSLVVSTGIPIDVSLLDTVGDVLVPPMAVRLLGFVDGTTLPAAGLYTIVVDPQGTSVGSVTLTLYDVSDAVGPLTSVGGAPSSVGTTLPGQNARVPFTGTAGQRISLWLSTNTIPQSDISVLNPDGTALFPPTLAAGGSSVIDNYNPLPVDGTYTVLIDPRTTYGGSVTLQVVTDVTDTIVPGERKSIGAFTPGQNMRGTFAGTTGGRISFDADIDSYHGVFSGKATIYNPGGTMLASADLYIYAYFCDPTGLCRGGTYIDTQTLAAAGTYSIVVDPAGTFTGVTGFFLHDVPPDVTGSVTVNGTPIDVSLSTAGQNASVNFSGTGGQQVTVHVTNNGISQVTVSLLDQAGNVLSLRTASNSSNFDLPSRTLPETATYTIKIDPYLNSTGSLTVSVTAP